MSPLCVDGDLVTVGSNSLVDNRAEVRTIQRYQLLDPVAIGRKNCAASRQVAGLISGGTSINTIAQEATMAYEYRSDSQLCLSRMQDMFEKMMEAYRRATRNQPHIVGSTAVVFCRDFN